MNDKNALSQRPRFDLYKVMIWGFVTVGMFVWLVHALHVLKIAVPIAEFTTDAPDWLIACGLGLQGLTVLAWLKSRDSDSIMSSSAGLGIIILLGILTFITWIGFSVHLMSIATTGQPLNTLGFVGFVTGINLLALITYIFRR